MRLIESLTAAAGVLADQAADRLDAWVEHHASADDTPGETPLGFTVPTGPASKGVDVKGLTGEQRARWLAEVKTRLDASTGGPWCTEERDNPSGRIISPYGVIATGVTREADRDLIEDARADLFGLLALAEYDDQIIEALQYAARHQTKRRTIAEHELAGMHEREAAVERVLDSLVDGRLKLTEYIDPETPAGRVKELVTTLLTQARDAENGDQVQHLTDDLAAARETIADLERKLDAHHRHDAATDADTVRARAAERILAYAAEEKPRVNDTYGQVYLSGLETAAALIVDETTEGEPSADVESPFLPAPQARAEAHLITVALNHIDGGHDPRGVLHFNDRPLAARVVATVMNARTDAIAEFVKHQVTHYRDHSANALDEDRTVAVRMGVAPAALLDEGELSPAESDAATVIIKAGGKFTPSVEGAVAQAMHDTEGAIFNSNGDRILTYGGGSAGDNPPAHIVVTSAGYVRDVLDDRPVGAQVKHPDPLDDLDGGTDG